MSISQVLMILWHRGWITLLTFLTAVLVALAVLEFVPGRYDAVATASIDPGGLDPITRMQGGSSPVQLVQGNLLELVASQRVATDVVTRLDLTANRKVQEEYRKSGSFGRESIKEWYASTLISNIVPSFTVWSNVLTFRYKSSDPNQAALLANAFLAATFDESIAMKAASAEQVVQWFTPQLDELRKQVEAARAKAQAYQGETNLAFAAGGGDAASSHLMTVTQNLSTSRANLTFLQSHLASNSEELSCDPSEPDLQVVNSLKSKLSELETSVSASKSNLGLNNPKVAGDRVYGRVDSKAVARGDGEGLRESSVASQTAHRPDTGFDLFARIRARLGPEAAIASQTQRERLSQHQREVDFRLAQLNAQERMAEQARLQSKMTLADVTLDKAVPPYTGSRGRWPYPRVDTCSFGRNDSSASTFLGGHAICNKRADGSLSRCPRFIHI